MPITTNYSGACIYTKRTNLVQWFNSNCKTTTNHPIGSLEYNRMREYYERVRNIQLILLYRYSGDKCYCRIKCPINPLPIRGEFEAASISAVDGFLKNNGWVFERKIPFSFLK